VPLSHFVRNSIERKTSQFGLSNRYPAAASAPYRAPDGRVWLDVLETFVPMDVADSPKLVVYHRVDLTNAVEP